MNWPPRFTALILVVVLALARGVFVLSSSDAPPTREELWKQARAAEHQQQPQTAIQLLDAIYTSALKDKAHPEAIKAIAQKILLESPSEAEDGAVQKIQRMQAAITAAPKDMRPVMTAILAHWWWEHSREMTWRRPDRAAVAESEADIRTWDLARVLAETDKTFTKALASEQELKATPIDRFDFLLEKGSLPDAYRPTLYDFLVHDALAFYTSTGFSGAKPEDAFELAADSPIFGTADDFMKWRPKTTDTGNPVVKAIGLYQTLLAFHKNDADRSAFLDADIHRLRFGWNTASGEKTSANYVTALDAFGKANAGHELVAMAHYLMATVAHREDNFVKAREIALAGEKAFPESPGGKLCFNLVRHVEKKSVAVSTECVWTAPLPGIRITYTNITKAYFRVVPADYLKQLRAPASRWRPESLTADETKALLDKKPAREFSHDLPATTGYQARTEVVPAPADLKPGFYYLIVSHAPDFGARENEVRYTALWVSNLAIIDRTVPGSGEAAGMVTDALTGEPIEGAKVELWSRKWDRGPNFGPLQISGLWERGPTVAADKNGLYRVAADRSSSHFAFVTHRDQSLATASSKPHDAAREEAKGERIVLFTDRSLYRPGQTVHFKGIHIGYDRDTNTYATRAGQIVEVEFRDTDFKTITSLKARTNDYGSFSGTFTAPRNRLPGKMTIEAHRDDGSASGSTDVTVEEYKRPKFAVELEAPKEAAALNARVAVPGRAVQYNGVPVGGVKVRFHVTRYVLYPDWSSRGAWWRPVPVAPEQRIAHGVVTTAPDGRFTIPFVAKAAPEVPEADSPEFHYGVTAEVTDTTGETRSAARSVIVGYRALRATIAADEWLTNDRESVFTLSTNTLDGTGLGAKGQFRIHALKQPDKVIRGSLTGDSRGRNDAEAPRPDPGDPEGWEPGAAVFSAEFETTRDGKAEVKTKLPPGVYRAVVETKDTFGNPVTTRHQFTVLNPASNAFDVKVPNVVVATKWSVEVGETFAMLWGTGYDTGRAFIEVEHRGKILRAFWTPTGATQHALKVPVTEELRGGFTVRVTQVRENRAYLTSKTVEVPWTNKKLTVKWERFVNKLEPGAKETFTAVVTGPDATKAVAEIVAAMYDASLDAYEPHDWMRDTNGFDVFDKENSSLILRFNNMVQQFIYIHGHWRVEARDTRATYRKWPTEFGSDWSHTDNSHLSELNLRAPGFGGLGGLGGFGGGIIGGFGGGGFEGDGPRPQNLGFGGGIAGVTGMPLLPAAPPDNRAIGSPNLGKISPRKNLNETAFFFPHLTSGEDGTVRISFEMSQALTKWKFMGFAHDKALRSGFLTDTVVTAKDLMAQPNPPRFLREGDAVEFAVKVSNAGATPQKGTARLSFRDARTDKPVDAQLGLVNADQPFDLAAGASVTLAWKITVPDDLGPIVYKAVAATDRLSDGEEAAVPVLSRRVLVTESLPLPIRGPGTKDFDFAKLRMSGASDTLRHQSLTVQMVSQPSWYAVMALPYLMEYPHECGEQTFNRLYANALARHIATSDPKIRNVFDQWKGTPALDSPLEKNADLKSVVLEETPWVREAQAESQARRNLGLLFDADRMDGEIDRAAAKLAAMQHEDGTWPWFPGGRGDDYITLYITTGYGRLRHLGVKIEMDPAIAALGRLDGWAKQRYDWAQTHKPEENHLTPTMALYLYGRSFFLADKGVADEHRAAIDYWLGQSKKHWPQLGNRQSQAHLALALKRFGDKETPAGILKSLKERSRTAEELGMYWADTTRPYSWTHAPIETQALMIEAFDEVANDEKAVEDCKVWLLKQKQAQNWHTTKATADAVYALLLRGDKLLSSDALVEVTLGNQTIKPQKVEAGTGFYEQKFLRTEVLPSMGAVRVKKPDKGVSWGSVHWSYLEDISKVTPHAATPLKLEKKLFKKTLTKAGPVIEPVKAGEALAVGDEVIVRIVLRTDRDLEYCHLKDHRGSGTEPVNVLSQYKYQDGLGYYEVTKDTASHFFIDYLPKGTYVFEYPVRVQLRGKYPTGFANIECMYAPEFNSHSESIELEVK